MDARKVYFVIAVCLLLASAVVDAKKKDKKKKPKEKPEWAKKDVSSYNDHDLEMLYEQWEEGDDPLEPDELPEWHPDRPQPMIDFSKLDMSNTDNVLKATKKGKTLMLFVKVSGNPTREETEQISGIWQTGLWNTHIQADRFLLEDDRIIFMFKDGEHAWDARDYFVEQERCYDVQLEQNTYCGKHHPKCEVEKAAREKKEKAEREAKVQERKKKEEEDKKKKEEEEKKKKEEEAEEGSIDEKDEL